MMKKYCLLFFSVMLGIAFTVGIVPSVLAQDADTDEFMLEEITVTAAKRSENQQKVPIAMETITAEQMKNTGMDSLDEILDNVSNVIINKAQDGLRVTIRGMSDIAEAQHGMAVSMPTVAVNMDGVYSNRKDTGSGLFDMERVEVLFGPQSTLYASNSPGGIVNVVTANPKLDAYSASGTLEMGNYELLHTEGALNAPINDTMALRAAFTTSVRDGYLTNGGDNEDTKAARLKVLYQPSDPVSVVLTGEISKTSTQRSGGVNSFYDGYYQDGTKVDDYWFTDEELPAPSVETTKKVTGRMDWDLGFASMSLVPSYLERSGSREERMAMGTDVTLNVGETSAEEKSVELRFASSDSFFFKWIAGVNYYDATNIQNTLGFDGSTGDAKMSVLAATGEEIQEYRNMNSQEEATAVFANITYPITDIFRATAGLRYSWDDVLMHNDETRGIMGGANAGQLEEVAEIHKDNYADPDYKIGFEYDLSENSMIYADYSTSYRVQAMGGGGPGTSNTEERDPEKLNAYTLGAKNRFFDNRLQVNTSAYYYDYQNFSAGDMVTGFFGDPNDSSTWTNAYTQNDPNSSQIGDGRMIGMDVSTTTIISSNDLLNLSVSYIDSEWTDLVFDYYYDYMVVGVMPGQPWGQDNIQEAVTVSYNGKPMTMSPEWTISGSFSHNFNLPNGSDIKAQIDSRYKSDYRMSWKDSGYPWDYQEECIITNLSATFSSADGKWSLTGYVKNISDYAEKRMYMTPGGGQGITTLGNPRTYGFVLTANF